RDVALGARERLASDVFGGNAGSLGVADLDAIAEDAIEPDPERREPGPRPLALLEPRDPLARLARILDQRRQRVAPPLADEAAFMQNEWRLVDQRLLEQREEPVERRDLVASGRHQRGRHVPEMGADVPERRQARAEGNQIAGVSDTERGAARQSLEIAHVLEQP